LVGVNAASELSRKARKHVTFTIFENRLGILQGIFQGVTRCSGRTV